MCSLQESLKNRDDLDRKYLANIISIVGSG